MCLHLVFCRPSLSTSLQALTWGDSTSPNITNLVTVCLASPEEYLTWYAQFASALVSYGLLCFVDGLFLPPTSLITSASTESLPNFDLHTWLHTITDSLAAINSPAPSSDLVHYTLLGLGQVYNTLVTTFTHVLRHLTFNDLHPILLLQEQHPKAFKDGDASSVSHPALVVHSTIGSISSTQGASS
ncbi:hypothetical protein Cgig2_011147 [Carnegiea gigantea]|uniref:Uncharacterized protein n=1 Tax=Carnegiea gigantea TaxID=171969 RepID=A0A9Q1JKL0_9CARY|nr:hypothetical protein Cgig2_011147 [Carnegiea gigantea]